MNQPVNNGSAGAQRYSGARHKRKRMAMEMRQVLLERFPKAFKGFARPKVPLKIGIKNDIFQAAPDLPRTRIRLAIHDYVTGKTYHRAAVPDIMRIDLEGNHCGNVTNEEAQFHAEALKKIINGMQRHQARQRAAKRAQNAISDT